MLRDSLKWMALTLALIAALAGLGLMLGRLRENDPGQRGTEPPAETARLTLEDGGSPDAASDSGAGEASPAPEPTPEPTIRPDPTMEKAEALLSAMTPEEKVGQMVMFGFNGASAPDQSFLRRMEEYSIGNVMLYGANIASGDSDGGFERASRLTAALNQANAAPVPLWIGIDVEGGGVVRFRWSPWPSSARTLGRRDPDEAREQFSFVGSTLRSIGITVDFAPVLDVAPQPMDSFLGNRIISGDETVAALVGAAMIDGLHEGGCLSVAKHFPGHGGATADSHDKTPVITRSLEALRAYDLVPFQAAVDAGVDMILVAHISYPSVDGEYIASQSQRIITGLLREELGFEGVVISDDFRMAGLTSQVDPGAGAVRFIQAGGDIVLCGADYQRQKTILDALLEAVSSGGLSMERVDQSVLRILYRKLSCFGY